MPEGGDPLQGIAIIAVERVGLQLSSWRQPREIAVVHTSGNVQRWLCACESRWHQISANAGNKTFGSRRKSADTTRGWGMAPADLVAELTPVLTRARIVAAETVPVGWWLTTLYGHLGEPLPCRVASLDDIHSELLSAHLLSDIERMKVFSHAEHRAACLHQDLPHLALGATRAIEALRQIAYRVEIGTAVVHSQKPVQNS